MTERERLARILCEKQGIDPDRKSVGLGSKMDKGREYYLWEYQAEQYVDVILED